MALYFHNGSLLIRNGGIAMASNCCCGCRCDCVRDAPDTLYLTVDWCDTSTITLTKYYESYAVDDSSCEKRYSGSGVFGQGPGVGFFRVRILADCNGLIDIRYCFDGCTTGDCSGIDNDPSQWTEFTQVDCDPVYGVKSSAAPPGACGSCMTGYTLTLSE